jgi:hypothetical protein
MAGYAVLRDVGDLGAGNRDTTYSAAGRPPSSSGIRSTIAEMGNKNMGENSPDSGGFGETPGNNNDYPIGSWDDSAVMSTGSKRYLTDDDRTLSGLNSSETQVPQFSILACVNSSSILTICICFSL